jgi:hypothetical protein
MKIFGAAAVFLLAITARAGEVAIETRAGATAAEALAARELARHLGALYPEETLSTGGRGGAGARVITLGVARLDGAESIRIAPSGSGAAIEGGSPRAVLFAVYRLLEKLGFGFYLSDNAWPEPRKGAIDFREWRIEDAPLASERVVFNWHNFLSGCTGWGLKDWKTWVEQAARMRYSGIMVHAYGNNPMFTFTHNGQTKPAGFLSTTRMGRDWGTQHVDDVRLMRSGEGVFDDPVFGSEAARVPPERRVESAVSLMRAVFRHAAERGLDVTFALDVDTETANPQNVIATLPAHATFEMLSTDGTPRRLPNPDTPEGYAYFRSQAEQLFRLYPQITQLAIWARAARTGLWCRLRPENFPAAWRGEYDAVLKQHPELAADADLPSQFAIAKIVRAFRRALDETGHKHVPLALGGWRFLFVPAADAVLPPFVKLMPLDWSIVFGREDVTRMFLAASRHRKVSPIVWAHHDDHTYIGVPYKPFDKFQSLLEANGATGFGIIHWTMRPLDLYFKGLAEQVWRTTRDQDLGRLCRETAARQFGEPARERMGAYLEDWIRAGPMFGRETTDVFVDQPLREPGRVLEGVRRRLAMLDAAHDDLAGPAARARWKYHRELEIFFEDFFHAQLGWEAASAALKRRDLAEARRALADADPGRAIRQYVRASVNGGMGRSEQGLVVSLNLRWLPMFESLRQAAGLAPARYRFAPTQHEEGAQGFGSNTFAFDGEQRLWKVLGAKETGGTVERFALPAAALAGTGTWAADAGLVVDRELELRLKSFLGEPLPRGAYEITLTFSGGGGDTLAGHSAVAGSGGRSAAFRMKTLTGGSRELETRTLTAVLAEDGDLRIALKPGAGRPALCALEIRWKGELQ